MADLAAAQYGWFLSTYLRPFRRRVASLALLLFGGVGLRLVGPQIVRAFIDTAQSGGSDSRLGWLAVLYLAVAVVTQLVAVGETFAAENLGWLATNALRADLVRHCLALDRSFHGTHSPGELVERVDGDAGVLANFFSRFVLRILGNGLLLAGVLALLFQEDWRVGLVIFVFALAALACLLRLSRRGVRATLGVRQASADLYGFLEERLDGRLDLQAIGAGDHTLALAQQRLDTLSVNAQAAARATGGLAAATSLLFAMAIVLALGMGALLYLRGEASLGAVYLLFQYAAMLNEPLGQLTKEGQDFQSAGASLARVQQLLDQPPRRHQRGQENRALPPGPLTVAFSHVTFGYDPDDAILHDVSFHLESGQVLGLLGRTGSGKSTIARLLVRLHDPVQGAICLGGVDLRDLHPAALPPRVGLVPQEVRLFRATLRDNLTLFQPGVPDARLHDTLSLLGLADWCRALPRGLDTEIGPGEVGVSAGQEQLIAFARVFLREPGLIILDEASSRLDPATERLVEAATDRLLLGRTAIIIAHRPATLARADRILILEQGHIVESGSRAALAADSHSRYARLLRAADGRREEGPA